MNMQRLSATRRQFLRSAGVCLTLPLFDSLLPGNARAAAGGAAASAASGAGAGNTAPQRFAFIYTPNGYEQNAFLPEASDHDWSLTSTLEPLKSVKDQITLITGLDRQFVPGTGVHAQAGACWLTSSPPQETLDGGFPTNTTVDQMIARAIGRDTALPSLEMSCNDHTDSRETRYFESISWYGPGSAATTEKNPRAVFQRLFGKPKGDAVRSVLDTVLQDARAVAARLGREDKAKFDQYLTSVRQTERRIQLAEQAAARIGKPPMPQPKGIPERRGEYIELMGDLMVMAFQLDLTRVVTLVIDPERWDSPRMYHEIFEKPQNHHVLTHTRGDEAKEKLARIDRFHIDHYARIVRKLQAINEGEGTLLDNSLVVMGSGMSDGRVHDYGDLQVLLAGGAGGAVEPGKRLHYKGEHPLANLWLSTLHMAGDKRKRFADSTGVLPGLHG